MNDRYKKSEKLLRKALQYIPLGAQTFSKSITQFPFGVSPYFLDYGKGSHVWDVDGNEYIDFVNSLAAITLGYNDLDVDRAVKRQLKKGVTFSLSHPVEIQLAEMIVDMVPCAEMVRFGKNGSDVTAGAIRLARASTGRDHVAVCGYHGWQDWYIGSTTRDLGVPEATKALTHKFIYNDLSSLERLFVEYTNQIAVVILEPMNIEFPKKNFLQNVKDLTHKHGAILVFDEMVTGFRFAKGGAQEYFGVTPDLAAFGKGIANGYPLSALVGSKKIMSFMEKIFFSFTFGGETLSIVAAIAVLNKLKREPVIETLASKGEILFNGVEKLITKYSLENILSICGHPSWSFLIFKNTDLYSNWELKSLFLQEVLKRGVLTLGTHNMSYSHGEEEINFVLKVYDEIFPILKDVVENGRMEKYLNCKPLKPLFTVR